MSISRGFRAYFGVNRRFVLDELDSLELGVVPVVRLFHDQPHHVDLGCGLLEGQDQLSAGVYVS